MKDLWRIVTYRSYLLRDRAEFLKQDNWIDKQYSLIATPFGLL